MATALVPLKYEDYQQFVVAIYLQIAQLSEYLRKKNVVPPAILCSWENTVKGADKIWWYYSSHKVDPEFRVAFHEALASCGFRLIE